MTKSSVVRTISDHHRRFKSRWWWLLCLLIILGVSFSATADCIVQDAAGLTRGVSLGEGRVTVKLLLQGEKPAATELQLRRVTGLSAVVEGRYEESVAIFSGVSDGTWQISLSTSRIASVSIERPEGSLSPLQRPSSSLQNGE